MGLRRFDLDLPGATEFTSLEEGLPEPWLEPPSALIYSNFFFRHRGRPGGSSTSGQIDLHFSIFNAICSSTGMVNVAMTWPVSLSLQNGSNLTRPSFQS